MTDAYDRRFICPTCGRIPVKVINAEIGHIVADNRIEHEPGDRRMDGLLRRGSYACINGHDWSV